MVIQRIQTLYIIIAIGMMVAFLFVPYGYETYGNVTTGEATRMSLQAIDYVGFFIPVALSVLLMAVAIFLFKKMNAQKGCLAVAGLMIAACIGVVIYVLSAGIVDTNPEIATETTWGGGGLLLIAALIAVIAAHRSISRDQKLLRSYDRLR